MDITWLDGKSAENKFVLEIQFQNGKYGYLKNSTLEGANEYYNLLFGCPDVVRVTLYSPESKVVATKSKLSLAA
jgi:hypothetical protein